MGLGFRRLDWNVILHVCLWKVHCWNCQGMGSSFNHSSNRPATERKSLLSQGASSTSLPGWCQIDLDGYMSKCSCVKRHLCPSPPTRQDAFFWFEEKGPHFYLLVLQAKLVFRGVYGALLILIFIPAFHEASWMIFILCWQHFFQSWFFCHGHVRRVFAVVVVVKSTEDLSGVPKLFRMWFGNKRHWWWFAHFWYWTRRTVLPPRMVMTLIFLLALNSVSWCTWKPWRWVRPLMHLIRMATAKCPFPSWIVPCTAWEATHPKANFTSCCQH